MAAPLACGFCCVFVASRAMFGSWNKLPGMLVTIFVFDFSPHELFLCVAREKHCIKINCRVFP